MGRAAASAVVGTIIFVGLPLVVWGVGGFFASPVHLVWAVVMAVLQVFAVVYNPLTGRNPQAQRSDVKKHRLDLLVIQLASFGVVLGAPASERWWPASSLPGAWVPWVGLVLLVPGFGLMQAAEKHLGRQFSVEVTLQQGRRLVQDGPFRVVRHPRYAGLLLFFCGFSLVFRSLPALGVVAIFVAVFAWRIVAEERLLAGEFGDAWDAYRRRTWRLVPFLF